MEHRVDLRTAAITQTSPGVTELAVTAERDERTAAVVEAVLHGKAIAIPFAKFNDGRGFSIAHLLRSNHGFRGEVRATGHVIPDQAIHLLRAGFDTANLKSSEALFHWQSSLSHYKGAYQKAARNPLMQRRLANQRISDEQRASKLSEQVARTPDLTQRIREIGESIKERIAFSTSLGKEDQAILHAISKAGIGVDVFTLDTLRHFPETLETLRKTEEHYGIKIRVVTPDPADLEELIAHDGEFGFRTSVNSRKACCMIRKVLPLNRALKGSAGWITGLRREQSTGRADIAHAAWDASLELIKASPLADWSDNELDAYITENNIPVNPLHDAGFPSIGCQPCTRAVSPDENPRAGRWWWENEDGKECGLHGRERQLEVA